MLNLAGIVIGGIASAAQLFEEKELKTKKNTPDTIARRHTFRSV
jgi:hypothetical protein